MAKETIEIDLSLEDYFTLNEIAREKEQLLGGFIVDIVTDYIKTLEDGKSVV